MNRIVLKHLHHVNTGSLASEKKASGGRQIFFCGFMPSFAGLLKLRFSTPKDFRYNAKEAISVNTHLANQIEQVIAKIPKVELHLHLEGAIPLETLFQFVQRKERNSSIRSLDELRQKFVYTDFAHFIELWIWKNTFITDESDFEEIAYQVLGNLSTQHVKYVEAFYSPGDFGEQGFSIPEITEAIIAGKERAYRDFGIQSAFIIDLIRDHGPERGMRYLEEVSPVSGQRGDRNRTWGK